MKSIKIFNKRQARKSMKAGMTGLDASVEKWSSIANALSEIYDEVTSDCGLCLEYDGGCGDCILDGCGIDEDESYYIAAQAISDSIRKANDFLDDLMGMRK